MNYELAKELKDAGFPQEEQNESMNIGEGTYNGMARFPILSELIEACGDNFESLSKQVEGWVATSIRYPYIINISFMAVDSPEEAVARLWLRLKKSGIV